MKQSKPNRCKVALIGQPSAPTLFTALQIAYGLCGAWSKILVIGSSSKDNSYQHIGDYSTLHIPHDSTPGRYADILNMVAACGKEVLILSSLSTEWEEGVNRHLSQSYYEEVLRSHNTFMSILRHFPLHIIGCVEMKRSWIKMSTEGVPKIDLSRHIIQQPGVEKNFTTVLKLDKRGRAKVVKDLSQALPTQQPFYPTYQAGALLQDWCRDGRSYVPEDLQQKINQCTTLRELYQLLFDLDVDDTELISAFTRRRIELEGVDEDQSVETSERGLYEH